MKNGAPSSHRFLLPAMAGVRSHWLVTRVYHPSYWRRYFESQFVPAIEHLLGSLESRLLPNFKESDISHQAEAVADEAWEAFMSMPSTGDEDPSDFAEAAQEAGRNHYMVITGIRQGIINMFAAGLHHAFEQQFLFFHREELVPYDLQHDKTQLKIAKAKAALADRNIDVTSFESWDALNELRLVANTVKHAEGDSSERLRKIRPDLFEDPRLKEFSPDGWSRASSPIYLPMVGEDLFVTVDDLNRYKEAIVGFWRELADALSET